VGNGEEIRGGSSKSYKGSTYNVPVQIHLIRQTNGTGGLSVGDAMKAFNHMNEYYIHAGVHFYQCAPLNVIDNSTFYDYDYNQMEDLDAGY
jgi:hypothetical protein